MSLQGLFVNLVGMFLLLCLNKYGVSNGSQSSMPMCVNCGDKFREGGSYEIFAIFERVQA